MNPAQFVIDFPEFANPAVYPVATIQFWINVATQLLSPTAWGSLLPYGIELYTAHNLVLSQQSAKATAVGGAPGSATGVTASKSIDKVSVSYDVAAGTIAGAGNWNLTTYGTRYAELRDMVGLGGYQTMGQGYVPDFLGEFPFSLSIWYGNGGTWSQ